MALKRKSTLDQIAEFLTPVPEIGSDDDLDFETTAKVVEDYEDEFSEEDKSGRPRLKQSAALDDDPRYTGRRISRRDAGIASDSGSEISGSSDAEPIQHHKPSHFERDVKPTKIKIENNRGSGGDGDNENDDDDDDDNDNDNLDSGSRISEEDDHSLSSANSENDEESEGEVEDDYSIMNCDDEKEMEDEDAADDNFQHISSVKNVDSEIEKGKAVKNQLNIWDNLLECRIHLQKCVVSANRLPKHHNIDAFKEEGGIQFSSEMKKTEKSVKKLLDKFVELQEKLVSNYSETENLSKKAKKKESISDEEIPSDSDQEENVDLKSDIKPLKKKRRLCEDYEEILNTTHKQYLEFRDATIQKWNDRTRLITGKASSRDFSAFEQGTLQQIQHVLSNRTRLVLRTRIPRTIGQILGDPEHEENLDQSNHDPEIFDDSDFYHQLLREIIEKRTDDSQDSIALGRRWAALQKLRTKMKRKIDTRATKGRRLRYVPHQKLVGYMAPRVLPSEWSEKATTDLFNSLFGKQV